jgi:hypothetical protein
MILAQAVASVGMFGRELITEHGIIANLVIICFILTL